MGKLLIYPETGSTDRTVGTAQTAASLDEIWSNGRIEFSDPRCRVIAELRAECRDILSRTRRFRKTMCDRRSPTERHAELRQMRLTLQQLRRAIVTLRSSMRQDGQSARVS